MSGIIVSPTILSTFPNTSESCLVYVVLEPLVVRLLLLAVAYKLSFSHPVAQLCVVGVESLTNLFLSIPKLRV